MKQYEHSQVLTTVAQQHNDAKGAATMTISTINATLTSSDRPTIIVPPTSEGPFQGWGTRIG
jgi:hypothetical protein